MKYRFQLFPASIAKDLTPAEIEAFKSGGAWPIVVNDVFIPEFFRPELVQVWYGGSGSGKSDAKATELLLKCITQPYFRGLFTRKYREHIRDSQFLLFKDLIDRYRLKSFFRIKESEMDIVCTANGNMLLSGGLDDVDKLKSIADITDIWIEEPINRKDSVHLSDFTELVRRLRSDKASLHLHLTFNPISKATWIYSILFKTQAYKTRALKTTYLDNHFRPPSEDEKYQALKEIDYNEWNIYANGEWGEGRGEGRLFSDDSINDMFTNTFVKKTGKRYITADIAFSNDKFVIMVWDGWVVIDCQVYDKAEPSDVIRWIERAAREHSVPARNICYDASGAGYYLKSFLRTSVAFFGGATPMEEAHGRLKNLQTIVKKPQYENLRAQCFFMLQQRLNDCGIYFEPKNIHLQEIITQELMSIKEAAQKDTGKLKIIPKEEIRVVLGHSPDFSDALSMRAIFDLVPPPRPTRNVA